MRKHSLVTDQYYHIYNRGVDKRDIFIDKKDILRFVLSIKEFNKIKTPLGEPPLVSIVCYCFNPNHFHFILKQETEGGISEFLQRLLGGYSRYFNRVHNRSGALFQGKFKSHLINDEQYFLKIFPYVNINHMIHNIPEEKRSLILSSDTEYENMKFDLVSKKEAEHLLGFYGSNNNFKNECLKVSSIIREQREEISVLLGED